MKKFILTFLGCAVGFAIAWAIVSQRSADALRLERALWLNEKSSLEAALAGAKNQKPESASVIEKKEIVRVCEQTSPAEIIQKLQQIRISSDPGQIRNTRLVIQQFENLIALGSPALPSIRDFLLRNEEIDYDSSLSPRGSRDGRIATEFTVPPSLRFGLFDAAKQIGGEDAEKLLAEILSSTGRGAEIAYLARSLQEIAPFKYRDVAVNAARELLARPLTAGAPGLDKFDREYLYGVLALYGDTSFTAEAQTQLVRTDGAIDRGALKYLQQTLGAQALPSVMQAYQDPSIEASKKEPLVRYALTFAGADPQATEFWHKAITDPAMPFDDRRELIEDLNQDGIQNEDKPTARDAQLITNRLALIDKFYSDNDPEGIKDAWKEAQKDLRNMLTTYLKESAPK